MNKTQIDLLEVAKNYQDNPAIRMLLTSIESSRVEAEGHLKVLQMVLSNLLPAVEPDNTGYRVKSDHSDFVQGAARASAAMSRLSADFLNLATLLQALGEDVSY